MVVKIVVEVLLVCVILISGSTWWVLKKRDKLLDTMIEDKGYLERVLTPELLEQVAAGHPLVGGAVGEIGHEVNLRVVEASDRKAQMRLRQISLAFSLLAVFGSFWLGVWFMVANTLLFFLSAATPLGKSGTKNALDHLLTIAAILREWSKQDDAEGSKWVSEEKRYQMIYSIVRRRK